MYRKKHELIHEKKVKCPVCKLKFTQLSISLHVRRHNKFECDLCGYKVAKKIQIQEHFLTHLNSDAFKCTVCSKTFGNRPSLQLHEKFLHQEINGSQKFVCKICQKHCKNSKSLYDHKKVHSDRKTCTICAKSFCSRFYRQHLKSHENKQKIK